MLLIITFTTNAVLESYGNLPVVVTGNGLSEPVSSSKTRDCVFGLEANDVVRFAEVCFIKTSVRKKVGETVRLVFTSPTHLRCRTLLFRRAKHDFTIRFK